MGTFGRIAGVLAGAREHAREIEQDRRKERRAGESHDLAIKRQAMQEWLDGWRDETTVPRVELPGLTLSTTLPGAQPPRRPDTAPVETSIIDPTRYDTRTGVPGKVFDRLDNRQTQDARSKARARAEEIVTLTQAYTDAGYSPKDARLLALGGKPPEKAQPVRMGQVVLDTGKYAWDPTTGALGPRLGNAPRPTPRPTPRVSPSNDTAYRSHMLRRIRELTRGQGTPGRMGYVAPLSEQDARNTAQREWDALANSPATTPAIDEQAVTSALEVLRSGRGTIQQLEQSRLAPEVIAAVKARWGQR
jgi:hypothetical protein